MIIPIRNPRPARIILSIEKLVLRGIAHGDRPHLVADLRSQLEQALSNPATRAEWARSSRASVLKLGQIGFTPGPSGSRKLGHTIGNSIIEKLSGGRPQP